MPPIDRPIARPVDRPALRHKNSGWGVALLIIALAVVIDSTAAYIHYTTSARSAQDPMFRAKGEHR